MSLTINYYNTHLFHLTICKGDTFLSVFKANYSDGLKNHMVFPSQFRYNRDIEVIQR